MGRCRGALRLWGSQAAIAWAVALTVFISTGACLPIPQSVDDGIVIDTDDFDVLLDRYTNSQRDYGCTMQLMTESDQSHAGFTDVISNARSTIDIETLNFDDDGKYPQDVALGFAHLLADKVRSGVRMAVLLDGLTNAVLGRPGVNQALLDGGVEVRQYQPDRADLSTGDILFRTHKKILVADGERAITGGSNYGYRYEGVSTWRDTNVLLTGPIVATIQHEFEYDWDNRTESAFLLVQSPAINPPDGTLVLREIDQKPSEDDFDINNAIRIGLRLAKRRVDIEAPYYNPTDWMMKELVDAVGRGVEVRILTNSSESTDVLQVYWADASMFEASLSRGIRIFLWDSTIGTMHSKAMIVDDSLAMVGTYNFNARSILWDTENAVFSTDPDSIRMIDEMIQKDLTESNVREIDLDWVRSQPFWDQVRSEFFGLGLPIL